MKNKLKYLATILITLSIFTGCSNSVSLPNENTTNNPSLENNGKSEKSSNGDASTEEEKTFKLSDVKNK